MRPSGGAIFVLGASTVLVVGGVFGLRAMMSRETVKIASVLPRGEPGTEEVVRGLRLALEEEDHRAGRFKVEYQDWDEMAASPGAKSPHDDPEVLVLFGRFDTPNMRYASRADPTPLLRIPMVAGWSLWYSTADREFWTPATAALELQGGPAAELARRAGARRVLMIRWPIHPPGVAEGFLSRAKEVGLTALPELYYDFDKLTLKDVVAQVQAQAPDALFLNSVDAVVAGQLVDALRNAGFGGTILATDNCVTESFLKSGKRLDGTLLLSTLTRPTPEFSARYAAAFGEPPGPAGYLAYRACRAALQALASSPSRDRAAVLKAALSGGDFVPDPPFSRVVVRDGCFSFVEEAR